MILLDLMSKGLWYCDGKINSYISATLVNTSHLIFLHRATLTKNWIRDLLDR